MYSTSTDARRLFVARCSARRRSGLRRGRSCRWSMRRRGSCQLRIKSSGAECVGEGCVAGSASVGGWSCAGWCVLSCVLFQKRVSVKRSYGTCDWGRTHIAVECKHTEWRDHHTKQMWHQRGTLFFVSSCSCRVRGVVSCSLCCPGWVIFRKHPSFLFFERSAPALLGWGLRVPVCAWS